MKTSTKPSCLRITRRAGQSVDLELAAGTARVTVSQARSQVRLTISAPAHVLINRNDVVNKGRTRDDVDVVAELRSILRTCRDEGRDFDALLDRARRTCGRRRKIA